MQAGDVIGPYRIVSPLGRGGMGVVYRAHDTRLGREVALKTLPPDVAGDAARLARFEREARILASLSHPNIAALYGLERDAGRTALVLELVEGQTLADRIAGRPMAWHEALAVARQIAHALDAVHDTGIVHRDLKPANVSLTPTGHVKVLDFGVAKPLESLDADTITLERDSALLGTVGYMSPEQVRGLRVDKRCDVWAFGCIVYEMLTGRPPFAGATAADTVAAILEREPDWSALPDGLSPDPRPLIRRCLERDPNRRLRDLGDVEMAWESARPQVAQHANEPRISWRPRWQLAAAGAVFAALVTLGIRSMPTSSATTASGSVTRFEINTETPDWVGIDRPVVAFSPDGSRLAYVDRRGRLTLRSVDSFDARGVPGDAAGMPFFSPDGRTLGFFRGGTLNLYDPDRSATRTVLTLPMTPRGATWIVRDEIIIGAPSTGPLQRISMPDAEQPRVEPIGYPDASQAVTEAWPDALPGGSTVLCVQLGSGSTPSSIVAVSLETGKRTTIIEGTAPHYLASGYLVFHRERALMGVRFDANQLTVLGTPVTLIDDVPQAQGVSHVTVSRSGDVAYATSVANRWTNHLVLVDRQGHTQEIPSPARGYVSPRVSPDGTTIVVAVNHEAGTDLWTYSLVRGTWNQITFKGGGGMPIWTPSGDAIVYSANFRDPAARVYRIAPEGGVPTELNSVPMSPHGFTPDGRYLVGGGGGVGLRAVLLSSGQSTPLMDVSEVRANTPTLSPDGRWLAYIENGTGDDEGHQVIYVRRFLAPGGRWRVSTEAGSQPRWSRDGRELYYFAGERMMAVRVSASDGAFVAERPVQLFEGRFEAPASRSNFDVLADGRFVMIKGADPTQMNRTIRVVRGWEQEVRRLVGVAQ